MASIREDEGLKNASPRDLNLLETGWFSDFSVICGDRTWKTHKAILCRIEYFKTTIMGDCT
ncbi:hypothetical protein INS49_013936 [Diaporthe citri]|uniref:uncharacterized protein n=1 Tax=Diaporthe citri TaxID=83186 RepID=UPI001C805962|nr:uncharacterized protein INS49_013936 [Diaporthe citri]KAG6358052.1 hypothetical protein INS49_013936 [Diaporthe citri]